MKQQKLHILIVEDHALVRLGIEHLLTKRFGQHIIIAKVENGDAALQYLKKQYVDIILLDLITSTTSDIHIKSGDELLREIYYWEEKPKVIIISKIDGLDMLDYCIEQLDVEGYIVKSNISDTEVIPAIEKILSGENYYSAIVRKKLKYKFGLLELDSIDRIILKRLSKGFSQDAIALALNNKGIQSSRSAVEKRVRKLRIRFEAENTTHLVTIAIKNGII